MTVKRPRIGMIISENPLVLEGKYIMNSPYIRAIEAAGGLPVLFPAVSDERAAVSYAEMIDGLLIPGGQDIAPVLYGQDPSPHVVYSLADTDRLEMALIHEADRRGLPVFGICRGMQLINVAFGGSLIQDVCAEIPGAIGHRQDMSIRSELTHHVSVEEGSLLFELLGSSECLVNSFHHQAVKSAASGFHISACSSDGIAEAMEREDRRIYAVQWHPEELFFRYPVFQNLFTYLVGLASEGK